MSVPNRDPDRSLPRLDLLRQMTDRAVFEAIALSGPTTRAELATRTGISKPTISLAVGRLLGAGIVAATGLQEGRRGRVATFYDIAAGAGIVVAAELDQAGIAVRTVDLAGRTLSETAHPPTPAGDSNAFAAALHAAVRQACSAPVLAIGVSVANPVDPSTGRVVSLPDGPFPEGEIQPTEVLRDLLTGPILVDNDVNLAALAERRAGAAREATSFVYLYLGAGLGAASHVGDTLVRGAHGFAGEVGWLPTSTEAGATLARQLSGRAGPTEGPPALDVVAMRRLLDAAPSTQRDAGIARLSSAAAYAAAALCAAVDPTLILLGGPLGGHVALRQPFDDALRRYWPHPPAVEVAELGDRAPLLGATFAALAAARESALAQLG
jgi:predicted NBD/HSP70 family sugar kinase